MKPNETVEVFVGPSWDEATRKNVKVNPWLPETILRQAVIGYGYVCFDANNVWSRGGYLYRDPQTPDIFRADEKKNEKMYERLKK